ncbi:FliI/YscN family ATPase [Salinisphaera sp.]|uniref:FliI/YscN family ATPase n=1 Tax=Salinisphaera sp. TaxID=1914330 RepID=UPI002D77E783|nr:FliI/YscN family ATPase [Salinisphaera sp.]HET7314012.1 FliI/YscN family ATPase [Salinisphaera sp.]
MSEPEAFGSKTRFAAPSVGALTERLSQRLEQANVREVRGRIRRIRGVLVYASLSAAAIGELCILRDPLTDQRVPAEVVGFEDEQAVLTPIGDLTGLSTRTEVIATGAPPRIAVGRSLLGRVISPLGAFLDRPAEAPDGDLEYCSVNAPPPAPLERALIDRPLSVGVRAIDGLVSIARGQRVGIFGEPGVGKSSLLAAIVRNTEADVIVLALVGERGREVRELLDVQLGAAQRARTVAVVATSDRPAIERARAATVATRVAEHFRDQGADVLLLMDSVTRFARAQREIGLAAGEPPTRRGYPPSLFAALPRLLERAGMGERGSMTGLYTVLTEGDAELDPVAEETRAILDGHIVLARELAQRDHFPAIDVLASRSRLMNHVVSRRHRELAAHVRNLIARYREVEFLLRVGEYTRGEDAETDEAIDKHEAVEAFLRQAPDEAADLTGAIAAMQEIVA